MLASVVARRGTVYGSDQLSSRWFPHQETDLSRQTRRRARRTGLLQWRQPSCVLKISRSNRVLTNSPISRTKSSRLYTQLEVLRSGWSCLATDECNGKSLAPSVNWTTQCAVTPVKDRGHAGFSTTGLHERAWSLGTGNLVSLNEQQLVDCDIRKSGCNGGSDFGCTALSRLPRNTASAQKGVICTPQDVETHSSSSYTVCLPHGGVVGFLGVATDGEQALSSALSHQPVSIAMEGGQSSFLLYKTGVLTAKCGTKVVTSGEQGCIGLQHWKGGTGECGLLSGLPSRPIVSCSRRQLPFLCARMPTVGTTALAVSRVRRCASFRVPGTKITVAALHCWPRKGTRMQKDAVVTMLFECKQEVQDNLSRHASLVFSPSDPVVKALTKARADSSESAPSLEAERELILRTLRRAWRLWRLRPQGRTVARRWPLTMRLP